MPFFLQNDIVFLRGRLSNTSINRTTPVSARYLVESVSAARDELVVAPTQTGTTLTAFQPGAIVYKTVPGLGSSIWDLSVNPGPVGASLAYAQPLAKRNDLGPARHPNTAYWDAY